MHFLGFDYIPRNQMVSQRVYLWVLALQENQPCSLEEATRILLNPRLRLGEPLAVVMPERIWPDGRILPGFERVLSSTSDLARWLEDPDAGWLLIPDMDALAVQENQSPDVLLQRLRLAAWRNETTVIIYESAVDELCQEQRNWRHHCWGLDVTPEGKRNRRPSWNGPIESFEIHWERQWLAPHELKSLASLNHNLSILEKQCHALQQYLGGYNFEGAQKNLPPNWRFDRQKLEISFHLKESDPRWNEDDDNILCTVEAWPPDPAKEVDYDWDDFAHISGNEGLDPWLRAPMCRLMHEFMDLYFDIPLGELLSINSISVNFWKGYDQYISTSDERK